MTNVTFNRKIKVLKFQRWFNFHTNQEIMKLVEWLAGEGAFAGKGTTELYYFP